MLEDQLLNKNKREFRKDRQERDLKIFQKE